MQDINSALYATNSFYRDLVDKMIAAEKEGEKRQLELENRIRQRQMERDRLQAELDFQRRRLLDYTNQIPYQSMTPVAQGQYSADFPEMQSNFVHYWSAPPRNSPANTQLTAEQRQQIRRAFHLAVSAAACFCKPDAPVASLVFDGLGIMTADSLLDAAKAAASIADTIGYMTSKE